MNSDMYRITLLQLPMGQDPVPMRKTQEDVGVQIRSVVVGGEEAGEAVCTAHPHRGVLLQAVGVRV